MVSVALGGGENGGMTLFPISVKDFVDGTSNSAMVGERRGSDPNWAYWYENGGGAFWGGPPTYPYVLWSNCWTGGSFLGGLWGSTAYPLNQSIFTVPMPDQIMDFNVSFNIWLASGHWPLSSAHTQGANFL